jgi:hypothetical protein
MMGSRGKFQTRIFSCFSLYILNIVLSKFVCHVCIVGSGTYDL